MHFGEESLSGRDTEDVMNAEISTEELNNEIRSATDIEDYLGRNKKHMRTCTLTGYLALLLEKKGMTRADVVRSSQLDRAYVYQIFSGDKMPSRDKLIALAFGMGLTEEEAKKMLKLSCNRELYAKDERDAVLLFALQRGKTVFEVNELLYSHGLPVLSVSAF